MGLGTWESYLTNHIEGFFNKRFSSNLEVAELMNGVEREVSARRVEPVRRWTMPFIFTFVPTITIASVHSASSIRSIRP